MRQRRTVQSPNVRIRHFSELNRADTTSPKQPWWTVTHTAKALHRCTRSVQSLHTAVRQREYSVIGCRSRRRNIIYHPFVFHGLYRVSFSIATIAYINAPYTACNADGAGNNEQLRLIATITRSSSKRSKRTSPYFSNSNSTSSNVKAG